MYCMFRRSILAVIASVLAIGASSLPVDARTNVGFTGRARDPADAGCFGEWWGTMTNYCGTAKQFIVPLTVDAVGYHTVTVTGYGATPNNNVTCQTFGVNKETTGVWGSGAYSLPRFGAAADISPLTSYVPLGGSLFVTCEVQPRGVVNVVSTIW